MGLFVPQDIPLSLEGGEILDPSPILVIQPAAMAFGPLRLIPKPVMTILKEASRHLLRHPVVGIAAAAHDAEGRWLLVRRGDTGTWGLAGGTLEWGETLSIGLVREVAEESGARVLSVERVVGAYSRPDRDPRFHAVTVVAKVLVDASCLKPCNPLEIREARLFASDEIPWPLAMGADDLLRDAMNDSLAPVLE